MSEGGRRARHTPKGSCTERNIPILRLWALRGADEGVESSRTPVKRSYHNPPGLGGR